MITLVEGMIGGGKSYYVMNELLRTYFTFNETTNFWERKSGDKDREVAIYTNIDGFHLAGDLNEVIENHGGISKFFTEEFQEHFCRMQKHIYVFDEVHEYFPRKWFDQKVVNFFRRHRHVGCDIFFMTQDYTDIAKEFQNIHEHHYAVVRQSFGLNPFDHSIRYQLLVGGKLFKTIALKKDLRVYMAYKSSNVLKSDKPKLIVLRYYAFLLLFVVFGIGMFYWVFHSFAHPKQISSKLASKTIDQVPEKIQVKKKVCAIVGDDVFIKDSKGVKKFSKSKYPDVRIGQEF